MHYINDEDRNIICELMLGSSDFPHITLSLFDQLCLHGKKTQLNSMPVWSALGVPY